MIGIEWRNDLWIIRCCYSTGRSSMKRIFKAITFFLPVTNEASFNAFSFASAPELQRNN
jgi:hypothetical protein